MSLAAAPPQAKVDRQTTTPFLLKLFYKTGNWHRLDEFAPNSPSLPPHLQIYTWPTCTLRELTQLLTSALPSLLPSPAAGTRVAFRLVYPDTRASNMDPSRPGRYLSKELGSIVVGASAASTTANGDPDAAAGTDALASLDGEPDKTLQDARFVIGDYVSCAVVPPLANGEVAPPPPAPGGGGPPLRGGYGSGPPRGGYGPPPENGYASSFRGRGPRGGGFAADGPRGMGGVPSGEWRRGERIPERGYGGGGAGGGYRGRGGRGRGW